MSNNLPREIYIVGLLLFFIVFGLFYLGIIHSLYKYDVVTSCNDKSVTSYEQGKIVNYVSEKTFGEDTNNLFSNIKTKITCLPDSLNWINWVFVLLGTLIIMMLVIVIAHG